MKTILMALVLLVSGATLSRAQVPSFPKETPKKRPACLPIHGEPSGWCLEEYDKDFVTSTNYRRPWKEAEAPKKNVWKGAVKSGSELRDALRGDPVAPSAQPARKSRKSASAKRARKSLLAHQF